MRSHPAAALCSRCSLPLLASRGPARPSVASSTACLRRSAGSSRADAAASSRTYATASGGRDDDIPAWPRSPHPTPYDVMGMPPGAPYNKRRFYQLVKLYHPDTHGGHAPDAFSSSSASAPASPSPSSLARGLSPAQRLERYRLVVAAHDLLSDPAKRRLYDDHGIGWAAADGAARARDADRAWRHRPHSAANNATWEDWERWHEARQGHRNEFRYMSNGTFATLVVMMCMVGALAQANRAETSGAQYVEFTQQRNAAIGKEIARNNLAAAGRSKDERVDCFLRERENLAYDFTPCGPNHVPEPPDRPA
ncbi:hypothetical protein CDD83_11090 [Cordyceps sp. RAO-2017]|nr:hypothetical protein CDD83_11090 [Cordyceps sp. RAO-2017]